MLRPYPVAKMGRSWVFHSFGCYWRLKRFTRRSPVVVVEFKVKYRRPVVSPDVYRNLKGLDVRRPDKPISPGTGKVEADDPLAFKGLPNLRSFFLSQTYDVVNEPREPGLMIVKAGKDGWQWTLKEPSLCLMIRLGSRTWDEGLMLLETFLGTDGAPWETDPYEAAKRGKSRKPKA